MPRRSPGAFGLAVATILRNEMEDQGLTQAQLGEMVNLSQQQVSAYLRGDKGMMIDEAFEICMALGLTPLEVLAIAQASI